jgi:hypothetical protein
MADKPRCGAVGLVALGIVLITAIALASSCGGSTASPGSGGASAGSPREETVSGGSWRYTVTRTARQPSVQWSPSGGKTAQGIWEVVHVRVENTGDQSYAIRLDDFVINDSAGFAYRADEASMSYSESNKLAKPGDTARPGVAAEIGLLFDVDPVATGLQLYFVQARKATPLGR